MPRMPETRSRRHAPLLVFASLIALAAGAAGCAHKVEDKEARFDGPSTLYAEYLAGRYADLRRDPAGAADRYFNALRVAPEDAVLIDGAVESALTSGDMARATYAARIAKKEDVESPLGKLALSAEALSAEKYGAARTALVGAQNGPPFDKMASRLIEGWALAGEGRTDAAVKTIATASDVSPFTRLFEYQQGLVLDYAGKSEAALKAYEQAHQEGFRLAPAVILHGRLLERAGRKDEALALYRGALADGDEPTIQATLDRAERGEPPPEYGLTRPAQGAAIGLYSLAALLLGQTDPDFYLPYLTLASTLDPNLDAARLVYAEGLREIDQLDAARAALGPIPQTSPSYELAQVQASWILRQQARNDEAVAAAKAAVEATNGRLARLALADLYRSLDRWPEAEALYDGLIKQIKKEGENDWRLYYARGAARERLDRWSEAEADLKHALELSPDQPEVLNYLGYSWVDQGANLKEGMALIERAVSLQPESGYIVDSLGWAHYKLGDFDQATEQLERAVELAPQDPILNDHLGDAYWRVGRRTEARFQWKRSLSLEPADKDRGAIERKMTQGLPPEPTARTARATPIPTPPTPSPVQP